MYENNENMLKKASLGDNFALGQLLEMNKGLILSIAKRFNNRGYELEDLYQIGCIGMLKSIKKFDFKYCVKFSTYAVPYILGEIKKFIRDDGIIKINRSTKKLSEILNVSEVDIVSAIEASRQVESINEEVYEDGNCTKLERITTNYDEQGKLIDKLTLNQMIDNLKERDKKVIVLRFYQEKTQAQVAKLLGISQVQVSRIEKRILKELKEKIFEENVS